MLDYVNIKTKLELLNSSTIVLIAGHKNADYDSIASCIALAKLLRKKGFTSHVLIEKNDMYKLEWLDSSLVINEYLSDKPYNLIILDANRKDRLGKFQILLDKAEIIINIDHHEGYLAEATHSFIDNDISSTAEIIANLCLEYDNILDVDIATLLYAGIVSDTNSFYYRTTKDTMKIASLLLSYGVDNTFVMTKTIKNMSLNESFVLSNMLSQITYDTFHYVLISRENPIYTNVPYNVIFKQCAAYIYSLTDISVFGLFLIELDGSISGLLRSNCDIEVDKLAKLLDGGGHKKAAGFETTKDINYVLAKIKEHIQCYN